MSAEDRASGAELERVHQAIRDLGPVRADPTFRSRLRHEFMTGAIAGGTAAAARPVLLVRTTEDRTEHRHRKPGRHTQGTPLSDRCPDRRSAGVKAIPGVQASVHLRRLTIDSIGRYTIWAVVGDERKQRRLEDALRRSEERFRRIFEYANDAVFVIDAEQDRIVEGNRKACRMLGYSRDELLRTRVSDVHPNEMPRLRRFAAGVVREGSGWTNELTCLTRSGEVIPAEISASTIELGGATYVLALVRDISERKRAQEALERHSKELERLVEERTSEQRDSERRHRVLLEINNAVVTHLTRDALFGAVSEAIAKILPYDRFALTLYDAEADVFRILVLKGALSREGLGVGIEVPREGSPLGWSFDNRRPVFREDLKLHTELPFEVFLRKQGIRSYLVAPLVTTHGALGTLNLGSGTPGVYTQHEADLMAEIGGQVALALENMLAYEEIGRLKADLEDENLYLQSEIRTQNEFEDIVGDSAAIKKVLKAVETVAPTDANVLILGETGTGKGLVARAIHELSSTRQKTLVKVNCAALPGGLIESELFGHEKGAFTGAVAQKRGRFELADGGTIFLDEIGDLPLELQAKLLHVLQEGEFERVGGSRTLRVRVRVIAATNRDLQQAVHEGRFREDLYYRLNVFPIQIPPLRERREDIPILIRHFVLKHGVRLGKKVESIPQRKLDALMAYPWPGNVRELENVIERAMIVTDGPELRLGDWLVTSPAAPKSTRPSTLEELERDHIKKVLKFTRGRLSGPKGAAAILGLKRSTLQSRMQKLGIKRPGR